MTIQKIGYLDVSHLPQIETQLKASPSASLGTMANMKLLFIFFLAAVIYRDHFVSSYVNPVQKRMQYRLMITPIIFSRSMDQKSIVTMSVADNVDSMNLASPARESHGNRGFLRSMVDKAPSFMRQLGIVFLPLMLQIAALVLFSFVHPAVAKAAKKSISKAGAVAIKSPPLWKKILEGVNTSGAFKARKAGDTRTEFAAILNSISSILIFGAVFFGAFLRHLQRENYQTNMMRKELRKVDEYKENMYFEAVQDILTKINDPKTKGSAKASLQKQLKDLDPEGSIQKFLDGGDRPDISNIIGRKQKPKTRKTAGTDKSLKKKRATEALPSADFKDDDDDDEEITSASKMTPKSSKEKNNTSDEVYIAMLGELYDGLEGVMSDDSRANVVEYLKERIEGITDTARRSATIRKIAEKLGDDNYWVDYASKLG